MSFFTQAMGREMARAMGHDPDADMPTRAHIDHKLMRMIFIRGRRGYIACGIISSA